MNISDQLLKSMTRFEIDTNQKVELISITRANYDKLLTELGGCYQFLARPFTHFNGAKLYVWDDPLPHGTLPLNLPESVGTA